MASIYGPQPRQPLQPEAYEAKISQARETLMNVLDRRIEQLVLGTYNPWADVYFYRVFNEARNCFEHFEFCPIEGGIFHAPD